MTIERPQPPFPTEAQLMVLIDIPKKYAGGITELSCLPLGGWARNRLLGAGVRTIEGLLKMSDRDILAIRQSGKVTLRRIKTICQEFYKRARAETLEYPHQPLPIFLSSEIKKAVLAGKTLAQIERDYGISPQVVKWITESLRVTKKSKLAAAEEKARERAVEKAREQARRDQLKRRNERITELVDNGYSYQAAAKIAAHELGEPRPISRQRVQQLVNPSRARF